MKNKTAALIFSGLVGIIAIVGITQSFYWGDVIHNAMKRYLPFRVDPAFSGGEPIATIVDPPGDDNGAGSLEYPLNPLYAEPHILDLVSYTVRKPQSGVLWSAEENFWQLDLRFGRLPAGDDPFSRIMARIYIDLDGDGKGSSVPLYDSELVAFTTAHPWDIAVEFDGLSGTARIRDSSGTVIGQAGCYPNEERRTLTIRLPLDRSPAATLLSGRPTWHYVTVSAAGLYDEGRILAVKAKSGKNNGGGADSWLTPPLYDILVPEGKSQQRILSGYNEESGRAVTLLPVEISCNSSSEATRDRQSGIPRGTAGPEQPSPDPESIEDPLWKGIALFGLGRTDEAEALLGPLATAAEPSPLALAYYGTLIAQKGGAASTPAEAIAFVWKGYGYLDKAVQSATGADRLHALNCRAAVSMAIPEGIFGMSASGMADYDEIAWMSLDMGDRAGAAEAWHNAARCARQAGREEDAELFTSLGGLIPLPEPGIP
jgi:hypothetical protein